MKAKMVLNALKCTIVGFMQPNPDEIFWLGDMRNWFAKVDFLRDLAIMVEAGRNRGHASASAIN
jgi:hypothetical protein